jgi:hypothetical protein
MPDYKNAKIYKLWSPEGDEIYIGSTIQKLCDRKTKHKFGDGSVSKILFEKYTDVRIELLEYFPCNNKEELNKKEGEYIRKLDCVNRNIAGRTQKEWCDDNKEKIKENKKEYRENNKDRFKEWCENNKEKIKEYRQNKFTCECGKTVTFINKARHERSKVHQAFICASAGNGEASISVPTNPGT